MRFNVLPGVNAFFSLHPHSTVVTSHNCLTSNFFLPFFPESVVMCAPSLLMEPLGGPVTASPLQCAGVLDTCRMATVLGGGSCRPAHSPRCCQQTRRVGCHRAAVHTYLPLLGSFVPRRDVTNYKSHRGHSSKDVPFRNIYFPRRGGGHDHHCLRYMERLMTQGRTHINERTQRINYYMVPTAGNQVSQPSRRSASCAKSSRISSRNVQFESLAV